MILTIYETRLSKIAELKSAFHGGRRINSTSTAIEFCQTTLCRYFADRQAQEEFGIVTLDTKNKVTGYCRITLGTLDASLVHPREVFRAAMLNSASSILLVHNHPSGDATPSPEDHAVTTRLRDVGKLVGIDVLDYIIIGDDSAFSCAESR